jgi:hypothetical protein
MSPYRVNAHQGITAGEALDIARSYSRAWVATNLPTVLESIRIAASKGDIGLRLKVIYPDDIDLYLGIDGRYQMLKKELEARGFRLPDDVDYKTICWGGE